MISDQELEELLRTKADGHLYHREGQKLEFKEQFSLASLADYFRDFAAFANNQGGVLLFGVTDKPRTLKGLSRSSIKRFEDVDEAKITGALLDCFSPSIAWHQRSVKIGEKTFGAFIIEEARTKPVIAKKDEGRNQDIKNGEIYYRYGGRTQKIEFAELESIIRQRIINNNREWQDLTNKISAAGPENVAILDLESAQISKGEGRIFVIDDELARKLKFIKEGKLTEKEGSPTLKLVGEVSPVDQVEVIKRVKENLTKRYPLSAMELAQKVKNQCPDVKQHEIWRTIKENRLKENPEYSAYNFRNKAHEDAYKETGIVPSVTPSIFNQAAVDLVIKLVTEDTGLPL